MDAPLPLPVADPLLSAFASTATAPVDAALPGDGATAEGFALLLEIARLALDTQPVESDIPESIEPPAEDASAASAAGSPALDTLLFLANVTIAAPVERVDRPPHVEDTAPTILEPIDERASSAPAPPPVTLSAVMATTTPVTFETSQPAPRTSPKDATKALDVGMAVAGDVVAAASPPRTDAALALEPSRTAELKALAPSSTASPTATPHAATDTVPVAFAQHTSPAPTAPPLAVVIDTPVQHPRFHEEAAERIVSLVTRGAERAELKVSPPDLGPVEVRIDVRGGEATLTIVAVQPATRDALESALPLLRDLLAQQGLALGQATVRDGRADAQSDGRGNAGGEAGAPTLAGEADQTPAARVARAYRLVDVFA